MDISKLTKDELITLRADIDAHLKTFKPFRIKSVYRRCGVKKCTCANGPANNEWGNLHGPYLYATWRDNGKTKTVSLGKLHRQDELNKIRKSDYRPDWQEFFTISPAEYAETQRHEAKNGNRSFWLPSHKLTDDQFEALHGVSKADDTMARYEMFYAATQGRYDAYWSEWNLIDEKRKAALSHWTLHGVGTVKGVKILDDLTNKGFYLKE